MVCARAIEGFFQSGGRRFLAAIGLLCLVSGVVVLSLRGAVSPIPVVNQPTRPAPATQTQGLVSNYGKLPLAFEVNQGQTDRRVQFLSHGRGYVLFLTGDEAVLTLDSASQSVNRERHAGRVMAAKAAQRTVAVQPRTMDSVLRMKLVAANARAAVMGVDELPGKSNYFIGNDPKKWRTDVANYAKVKYQDVYPGVDLVYYGNQSGQLEYDFVVAPGADPSVVMLDVAADTVRKAEGASRSFLQIAPNGDLVVKTNGGEVRFQKPVVYQEEFAVESSQHTAGENRNLIRQTRGSFFVNRQSLDGRYVLRGDHGIGFEVASYDHGKPLIIDPVLSYSTYMGDHDFGSSIAVDAAGNAYITGVAGPIDFPTTPGAFQTTPGGNNSAFITKLNATGSALIYSTYLSGSANVGGNAQGSGIAVDAAGNAYVTGWTNATDFPTTPGAFQGAIGGIANINAFVTKLNPAGSALVYSTYLGGNGSDEASSIALGSAGDAYVTGFAESTNFPIVNPFQSALKGGQNAFVTKFNAAGSALLYSTYLGGNTNDIGAGIAVDSSGNAYVTGSTSSTNFPTANPFQATCVPCPGAPNAFVTKLNAAGSALVYSTYLGGSGSGDFSRAIALDSAGNAYVTGFTTSNDFPTVNPFQATKVGAQGIFVTKFDASGSALVYSTYLGGSGDVSGQQGFGIAVDSADSAYVAGFTSSSTFPTANAFQPSLASGAINAFITKFSAAGSTLVYSSYLGGSDADQGNGIALDSAGSAYLTGQTSSLDFPTTPGVFQTSLLTATQGAFVTKIATPAPGPAAGLSAASLMFGAQNIHTASASQTETVTNTGTADLVISAVTVSGANAADFATSADTCAGVTVTPSNACTVSVTFMPSAAGGRSASLIFTDNAPNSPQSVTLTGTGVTTNPVAGVSPPSLIYGSQNMGTTSGSQAVTLRNTGTAALTITSIAASANFGESNNCGASVAANGSCTINVTFSPTVTGALNGTLVITDNSNGAGGSTQTVTLSGAGASIADFAVASSTGTQTVVQGGKAQYAINVTSAVGMFSNAVTLSCSNLPANSNCAFGSNPVTPGASGASSQLTIMTTAPGSAMAVPHSGSLPPTALLILLMATVLLPASGGWRRARRVPLNFAAATCLLLGALLAATFMTGCGQGGYPLPKAEGTPLNTYTITVTGTSGATQHKTTVTLSVIGS